VLVPSRKRSRLACRGGAVDAAGAWKAAVGLLRQMKTTAGNLLHPFQRPHPRMVAW